MTTGGDTAPVPFPHKTIKPCLDQLFFLLIGLMLIKNQINVILGNEQTVDIHEIYEE